MRRTFTISLNADDPFQQRLAEALTGWNYGFKHKWFVAACKKLLRGADADVKVMKNRMREIAFGNGEAEDVFETPCSDEPNTLPAASVERIEQPEVEAPSDSPCVALFE